MTIKAYLESIHALDLLIETKLRQEEAIREMLTGTQAHYGDGSPRTVSPTPDKIGELVAKLVDLQKEMNADIDRFVDMKAAIEEAVQNLPLDERTVLEGLYFGHLSAKVVAEKMFFTTRNVYYLRDKAIGHLEDMLRDTDMFSQISQL